MQTTPFAQIRGIALYEFRMHWRRRALKVVTIALALMLAFIIVVSTNEDSRQIIQSANLDASDVQAVLSFTIVFATGATVTMIVAFIIPVAFADTIPLDQQSGVRELLDAMPLPIWGYLAGKLAGLWLAVGSAMLGLMLASAAGWWVFVGAYDLGAYASLWLVGVGALIVLNGGFALLLTATQPNRRRAVLLIIGVMIVLIFTLGTSGRGEPLAYLNPLRMPIILYYLSGPEALFTSPGRYGMADVLLTIAVGLVELAMLGGVMWALIRRQHAR